MAWTVIWVDYRVKYESQIFLEVMAIKKIAELHCNIWGRNTTRQDATIAMKPWTHNRNYDAEAFFCVLGICLVNPSPLYLSTARSLIIANLFELFSQLLSMSF